MNASSIWLPARCFLIASATLCDARDWSVGEGQDHGTIQAALDAAAPGDTVHVRPGVYEPGAPIRLDKPLALVGLGEAVIDGKYGHELMTVTPQAGGSRISGMIFRNGGRSSTREMAGVRVEGAKKVIIEGNAFLDCNFAIYLAKAGDCTVAGNRVQGEPEREQNSGNGIHLWNCADIAISGNEVSGHRDGIYLEFAQRTRVDDNTVRDNLRYGLHFMSSNDCRYRGSRFSGNGAGVAVMYSARVEMTGNVFEKSWGGSSYGLLLKDIRDSRIADNVFLQNSTGVYAQSVSRTVFEGNILRGNGWALRLLSDGTDNTIRGNDFIMNSFDVAVNGHLGGHVFEGNYWDRYDGYDLRRDGAGDVPHRPVSLYGTVTERIPATLILLHSFMVQLLDRVERAFPSIGTGNVSDTSPAMRPLSPSGEFAPPEPASESKPEK